MGVRAGVFWFYCCCVYGLGVLYGGLYVEWGGVLYGGCWLLVVGVLWGVAAVVLWGEVFAGALGFTVRFYGCSLWRFYGCLVGGEGPCRRFRGRGC
jgi:hypothetical protein